MAKKATSSSKGGRVATAAASAALPTPPAQTAGAAPAMAQGMTTTIPAGASSPLVAAPAEVLCDFTPQAPSPLPTEPPNTGASASEAVAGQTELQGDMQQQPAAEHATPPQVQPPAEDPAPAAEAHPAIELARSFQTGAGRPRDGAVKFHTPPPPEVRRKPQGGK